MTTYLLPHRPKSLPPFPDLSLGSPSLEMRALASGYLEAASVGGLLDVDSETTAVERPGADPDDMFTDLQFAQTVLAEPALTDAAQPVVSKPTDLGLTLRQQAMRGPFVVKKLPIGCGVAVMNSQVLRSALFCRPELDAVYPALADLRGYEISVAGCSLTQDHLDLLLYAISCLRHEPLAKQAAPIWFTRRKFLIALGWTKGVAGYLRLATATKELSMARITYQDGTRPSTNAIARNAPLIELPHSSAAAGQERCSFALSASLCGLLSFGRNTVVELAARAAIGGEFGRWLHAFASSQKAGEMRRYDAAAVCAAGGLTASRLTDRLKTLRSMLSILEVGESVDARGRKPQLPSTPQIPVVRRFAPVVAPGWSVAKDGGGWSLKMARTQPIQPPLPSDTSSAAASA